MTTREHYIHGPAGNGASLTADRRPVRIGDSFFRQFVLCGPVTVSSGGSSCGDRRQFLQAVRPVRTGDSFFRRFVLWGPVTVSSGGSSCGDR